MVKLRQSLIKLDFKINKILAYPHSYKKKEIIKLYSNLGKKIIFTKKIREAETAKVIENIQRDVNIGLINEIYLNCKKMKIDFEDVIKLASTKWNFIKFKPGLVGGHCLPVDHIISLMFVRLRVKLL